MRKLAYGLVFFSLVLVSCKKEQQPLTKAEIKWKIDSLTQVRMRASDQNARLDLDYRMKIEVKVKVDSILNAKTAPANDAKDSTRQKNSLFKKVM